MLSKFFRTLFNPGEGICFGDSIYETRVRLQNWYDPKEQFFVINPLQGARLDANVTAHRNILVEFDKLSIENQKKLLIESGLPYSTLVFSGSKSLHAIISLEHPAANKEQYKALVKRIYDKLGGKAVVDISTSNPSRFSRTPEAIRGSGVTQTLLEVWERVPNVELLNWLGPAPITHSYPKENISNNRKMITARARSFLIYGAEPGEWNSKIFTVACDLSRCGFELDEAQELLSGVSGHLDANDRKTIQSAYNSVKSSGSSSGS